MADQRVLDRITAWQAAGLIDGVTADRLRIAEASVPVDAAMGTAEAGLAAGGANAGVTSMIGSIFGPSPAVSELFAYLGAGFVLAAWHVLVASWRSPIYASDGFSRTPDYLAIALEWGIPVVVLGVIGWVLARSGDRQRRAAGVLFAAATIQVYGAILQGVQDVDFRWQMVLATAGTAVAAAVFRLRYASLVTQATLLSALLLLASAAIGWLEVQIFGAPAERYGRGPGDPLLHELLGAAWWLGWAIAFGVLAWRETRAAAWPARSPDLRETGEGAAARRRADLTRFAAGMTAVGGVASSLAFGDRFNPDVLAPWIGDLAVLGVSAVLLALAARAAPAYLYPAALGVIIALTSLNTVYVAEQTGIGIALLVEGVILLGAGFAADRLRRRLARDRATPEVAPA
ncbi:MAG: hypothetical protein HY263_11115 [Chloroflexi bacterium]|nr:hypothetical protein [Chloroflexota bacterium]